MFGKSILLVAGVLALAGCNGGSRSVQAVGSSTVFPFTQAVAAEFVKGDSDRKVPVIQSIGTGPGIHRFCEGTGAAHPDIADASRRMRRIEFDKCQANHVGEIIEVPIGLDGIALVEGNGGVPMSLTRKDLYLALAANPMGKPNTAKTWKDVNPALPATPIKVLGPPSSSGTRDAFIELLLETGCLEAMPTAAALKSAGDPAPFEAACRVLRSDGAYVEEGEDDMKIVQAVMRDADAVGLLGYSYLERNAAKLHGISIDGVKPEYEAIASGRYPGARMLYLYVKKSSLTATPDVQAFLNLYLSMVGQNGPLTKLGLIAAPQRLRDRSADALKNGFALDPLALS